MNLPNKWWMFLPNQGEAFNETMVDIREIVAVIQEPKRTCIVLKSGFCVYAQIDVMTITSHLKDRLYQ